MQVKLVNVLTVPILSYKKASLFRNSNWHAVQYKWLLQQPATMLVTMRVVSLVYYLHCAVNTPDWEFGLAFL